MSTAVVMFSLLWSICPSESPMDISRFGRCQESWIKLKCIKTIQKRNHSLKLNETNTLGKTFLFQNDNEVMHNVRTIKMSLPRLLWKSLIGLTRVWSSTNQTFLEFSKCQLEGRSYHWALASDLTNALVAEWMWILKTMFQKSRGKPIRVYFTRKGRDQLCLDLFSIQGVVYFDKSLFIRMVHQKKLITGSAATGTSNNQL